MCPETRPFGTSTESVVLVLVSTVAVVPLNKTVLPLGVREKFVPEIVMVVPLAPTSGVNPEIVGALGVAVTVKLAAEEALPPGLVTEIRPVVAPVGTVAISCVVLADVTVAVTPLNFT